MKIAFIYPAFENIGIEYISSMLKKHGHKTQLFYDPKLFDDILFTNQSLGKIFSFRKKIINYITKAKPDIVLFSVVSADYKWACEYAKEIKKRITAKIIFGGVHVTSVPDIVIKHDFVDYIVLGEGELAVVELVKNIESDKIDYSIKNVWFKKEGKIIKNPVRPLIKDLDKLPFPDKEMYKMYGRTFLNGYTIMVTRGCINRCTFCYNDIYKKYYPDSRTYLRKRSIKNVIEELYIAKQVYKYKYVRIYDDDFTYNQKRLDEFSKKYREKIDLPYACFAYPRSVTKKTIESLKLSNCRQVNLGFENASEQIRKEILNRRYKNAEVVDAISLLKNAGIRVIVNFMMGIPTSDEKNIIENFKFFYKNTPSRIYVTWLQYLPRTKICKIALRPKYLTHSQIKQLELEPYNRSVLTADNRVYNKNVRRYQILFSSMVFSKVLAYLFYKTKLYKIVSAKLAIFLNVLENIKSFKNYEYEQSINLKRYAYFTFKHMNLQ